MGVRHVASAGAGMAGWGQAGAAGDRWAMRRQVADSHIRVHATVVHAALVSALSSAPAHPQLWLTGSVAGSYLSPFILVLLWTQEQQQIQH
ncbi:hypothetical protein NDU88_004309 [Pleurodeles waltl]|uniref:Uncharacterized protein n=1 Tax=Pleurodeles waltl TaxID=8319 RepID=A0AAV7VIX7_PLEWA|nr:hypothetical protein NDU88_004309 [Pleurodeles waltl]